MAAAARSAHHASTSETPASVVTKSAVFKLGIHPSAMHDALGGAKELLDGMLMRHHHQLGGVLVSYADARLVGSDARIIHQAGYCDVHVRCTARVFCPKPGRKLLGAVNKVVDHAELENVALQWASEINGKSPQAIRMLKYAFNLLDDGLVGQQMFAGEATRLAYMTDEAVEGRDAFLEKRDPDWTPFPRYF